MCFLNKLVKEYLGWMIDFVEVFVLLEVETDPFDESDSILPFEVKFKSVNEFLVGVDIDIDDADTLDDDVPELTKNDECFVIKAFWNNINTRLYNSDRTVAVNLVIKQMPVAIANTKL